METIGEAETQMETRECCDESKSSDKKALYRKAIETSLLSSGWKREIAKGDYDKAVNSVVNALTTPNQGVIISGEYGCGKTSFFKSVLKNYTMVECTLPESVECLDYHTHADTVDYVLGTSVFIDDLGAENLVSRYGVKTDIVGDFICRYHLKGQKRIFITTNLRGDELLARYGGRVFSRLKDLCIPVRFDGKDKRIWNL